MKETAVATTNIEIRSFAFLDHLQPQYAAFLGTVAQGARGGGGGENGRTWPFGGENGSSIGVLASGLEGSEGAHVHGGGDT